MMSLAAIRQVSDRAARRAASRKRVPYVPYDQSELDRMPPIPFPFLGSYVPAGWTPVGDAMFVDSSGLGGHGEPAMTTSGFMNTLRENLPLNYGYGIVEAGEFQVYVQAFQPPATHRKRRHRVS